MLSDAGKKYGEDIIGEYSKKLIIDVGKKYNYSDTKISYQLEDIQTFNLNSFLEAQEKFLGALLYYSDLESFIKVARLHIEENLGSDLSLINWNYTKYEV